MDHRSPSAVKSMPTMNNNSEYFYRCPDEDSCWQQMQWSLVKNVLRVGQLPSSMSFNTIFPTYYVSKKRMCCIWTRYYRPYVMCPRCPLSSKLLLYVLVAAPTDQQLGRLSVSLMHDLWCV